jgi:hypothetical protein
MASIDNNNNVCSISYPGSNNNDGIFSILSKCCNQINSTLAPSISKSESQFGTDILNSLNNNEIILDNSIEKLENDFVSAKYQALESIKVEDIFQGYFPPYPPKLTYNKNSHSYLNKIPQFILE